MFSLNVGVGHCLHLMLELVIANTSFCSWSLLTPHVGVVHWCAPHAGVGHWLHLILKLVIIFHQWFPSAKTIFHINFRKNCLIDRTFFMNKLFY